MPARVTHCVTVAPNMTWTVRVHGRQLTPSPNSPLSPLPEKVSPSTFAGLVNLLDRAYLYPGHPDKNFLDMANSRKGKFTSTDGKVTAFIDELGGSFNGSEYAQTVRTTGCTLLVHGGKCDSCKSFRPTLRAMYSRWCHRKSPHKFANNRYLNTPEKSVKLGRLASRVFTAEQQLKRLKERIEAAANENGVSVDDAQ